MTPIISVSSIVIRMIVAFLFESAIQNTDRSAKEPVKKLLTQPNTTSTTARTKLPIREVSSAAPGWSMKTPCKDLYKDIKGIAFSCADNKEVKNESTIPQTVYMLPDKLLSALDWQKRDSLRWTNVFGPRISGIVDPETSAGARFEIFPGVAVRDFTPGQSQYQKFLQILELRKKRALNRWDTRRVSRLSANLYWPWQHVERPHITALNPGLLYGWYPTEDNENHDKTWREIKELVTGELTMPSIRSILELVHSEWGKTLRTNFDLKYLTLAAEILKIESQKIESEALLSLIFELESFAHYSSITNRHTEIYTGTFEGLWVEVVEASIQTIRATELCQTERLFDELINLCEGRTAPVILNEYGSIADGNHRFTAVWLWNLLSATRDCCWSIGDDQFQRSIGEFLRRKKAQISPVTVHEILRHLALILQNREQGEKLREYLKPRFNNNRIQYQIENLPAVFISTYNNVAAIAEIYDRDGDIVRFEPGIYEALLSLNSKVLPERACYHFADRVPLPWFDLVNTEATEPHKSPESMRNGD